MRSSRKDPAPALAPVLRLSWGQAQQHACPWLGVPAIKPSVRGAVQAGWDRAEEERTRTWSTSCQSWPGAHVPAHCHCHTCGTCPTVPLPPQHQLGEEAQDTQEQSRRWRRLVVRPRHPCCPGPAQGNGTAHAPCPPAPPPSAPAPCLSTSPAARPACSLGRVRGQQEKQHHQGGGH